MSSAPLLPDPKTGMPQTLPPEPPAIPTLAAEAQLPPEQVLNTQPFENTPPLAPGFLGLFPQNQSVEPPPPAPPPNQSREGDKLFGLPPAPMPGAVEPTGPMPFNPQMVAALPPPGLDPEHEALLDQYLSDILAEKKLVEEGMFPLLAMEAIANKDDIIGKTTVKIFTPQVSTGLMGAGGTSSTNYKTYDIPIFRGQTEESAQQYAQSLASSDFTRSYNYNARKAIDNWFAFGYTGDLVDFTGRHFAGLEVGWRKADIAFQQANPELAQLSNLTTLPAFFAPGGAMSGLGYLGNRAATTVGRGLAAGMEAGLTPVAASRALPAGATLIGKTTQPTQYQLFQSAINDILFQQGKQASGAVLRKHLPNEIIVAAFKKANQLGIRFEQGRAAYGIAGAGRMLAPKEFVEFSQALRAATGSGAKWVQYNATAAGIGAGMLGGGAAMLGGEAARTGNLEGRWLTPQEAQRAFAGGVVGGAAFAAGFGAAGALGRAAPNLLGKAGRFLGELGEGGGTISGLFKGVKGQPVPPRQTGYIGDSLLPGPYGENAPPLLGPGGPGASTYRTQWTPPKMPGGSPLEGDIKKAWSTLTTYVRATNDPTVKPLVESLAGNALDPSSGTMLLNAAQKLPKQWETIDFDTPPTSYPTDADWLSNPHQADRNAAVILDRLGKTTAGRLGTLVPLNPLPGDPTAGIDIHRVDGRLVAFDETYNQPGPDGAPIPISHAQLDVTDSLQGLNLRRASNWVFNPADESPVVMTISPSGRLIIDEAATNRRQNSKSGWQSQLAIDLQSDLEPQPALPTPADPIPPTLAPMHGDHAEIVSGQYHDQAERELAWEAANETLRPSSPPTQVPPMRSQLGWPEETEFVPVKELLKYRMAKPAVPEGMRTAFLEQGTGGEMFRMPLILELGPDERILLGSGNTRLELADQMGVIALPVVILSTDIPQRPRLGFSTQPPPIMPEIREVGRYYLPSELGFPIVPSPTEMGPPVTKEEIERGRAEHAKMVEIYDTWLRGQTFKKGEQKFHRTRRPISPRSQARAPGELPPYGAVEDSSAEKLTSRPVRRWRSGLKEAALAAEEKFPKPLPEGQGLANVVLKRIRDAGGGGVNAEEILDTGLEEWLRKREAEKVPTSWQDIHNYLAENYSSVEIIKRGRGIDLPTGVTRDVEYPQYASPGARRHFEYLVQADTPETRDEPSALYRSGHYGGKDARNLLGDVMISDYGEVAQTKVPSQDIFKTEGPEEAPGTYKLETHFTGPITRLINEGPQEEWAKSYREDQAVIGKEAKKIPILEAEVQTLKDALHAIDSVVERKLVDFQYELPGNFHYKFKEVRGLIYDTLVNIPIDVGEDPPQNLEQAKIQRNNYARRFQSDPDSFATLPHPETGEPVPFEEIIGEDGFKEIQSILKGVDQNSFNNLELNLQQAKARLQRLKEGRVPAPPFKTEFIARALKQILSDAVDEGVDTLAVNVASTIAKRYPEEENLPKLLYTSIVDEIAKLVPTPVKEHSILSSSLATRFYEKKGADLASTDLDALERLATDFTAAPSRSSISAAYKELQGNPKAKELASQPRGTEVPRFELVEDESGKLIIPGEWLLARYGDTKANIEKYWPGHPELVEKYALDLPNRTKPPEVKVWQTFRKILDRIGAKDVQPSLVSIETKGAATKSQPIDAFGIKLPGKVSDAVKRSGFKIYARKPTQKPPRSNRQKGNLLPGMPDSHYHGKPSIPNAVFSAYTPQMKISHIKARIWDAAYSASFGELKNLDPSKFKPTIPSYNDSWTPTDLERASMQAEYDKANAFWGGSAGIKQWSKWIKGVGHPAKMTPLQYERLLTMLAHHAPALEKNLSDTELAEIYNHVFHKDLPDKLATELTRQFNEAAGMDIKPKTSHTPEDWGKAMLALRTLNRQINGIERGRAMMAAELLDGPDTQSFQRTKRFLIAIGDEVDVKWLVAKKLLTTLARPAGTLGMVRTGAEAQSVDLSRSVMYTLDKGYANMNGEFEVKSAEVWDIFELGKKNPEVGELLREALEVGATEDVTVKARLGALPIIGDVKYKIPILRRRKPEEFHIPTLALRLQDFFKYYFNNGQGAFEKAYVSNLNADVGTMATAIEELRSQLLLDLETSLAQAPPDLSPITRDKMRLVIEALRNHPLDVLGSSAIYADKNRWNRTENTLINELAQLMPSTVTRDQVVNRVAMIAGIWRQLQRTRSLREQVESGYLSTISPLKAMRLMTRDRFRKRHKINEANELTGFYSEEEKKSLTDLGSTGDFFADLALFISEAARCIHLEPAMARIYNDVSFFNSLKGPQFVVGGSFQDLHPEQKPLLETLLKILRNEERDEPSIQAMRSVMAAAYAQRETIPSALVGILSRGETLAQRRTARPLSTRQASESTLSELMMPLSGYFYSVTLDPRRTSVLNALDVAWVATSAFEQEHPFKAASYIPKAALLSTRDLMRTMGVSLEKWALGRAGRLPESRVHGALTMAQDLSEIMFRMENFGYIQPRNPIGTGWQRLISTVLSPIKFFDLWARGTTYYTLKLYWIGMGMDEEQAINMARMTQAWLHTMSGATTTSVWSRGTHGRMIRPLATYWMGKAEDTANQFALGAWHGGLRKAVPERLRTPLEPGLDQEAAAGGIGNRPPPPAGLTPEEAEWFGTMNTPPLPIGKGYTPSQKAVRGRLKALTIGNPASLILLVLGTRGLYKLLDEEEDRLLMASLWFPSKIGLPYVQFWSDELTHLYLKLKQFGFGVWNAGPGMVVPFKLEPYEELVLKELEARRNWIDRVPGGKFFSNEWKKQERREKEVLSKLGISTNPESSLDSTLEGAR